MNSGTYRIRIQYETSTGSNDMQLLWDYNGLASTMDGLYSNPKVVDANIQPNTILITSPANISVTFSQSLDTATLKIDSFRVRFSPDTTFFNADDAYLSEANNAIAWNPPEELVVVVRIRDEEGGANLFPPATAATITEFASP